MPAHRRHSCATRLCSLQDVLNLLYLPLWRYGESCHRLGCYDRKVKPLRFYRLVQNSRRGQTSRLKKERYHKLWSYSEPWRHCTWIGWVKSAPGVAWSSTSPVANWCCCGLTALAPLALLTVTGWPSAGAAAVRAMMYAGLRLWIKGLLLLGPRVVLLVAPTASIAADGDITCLMVWSLVTLTTGPDKELVNWSASLWSQTSARSSLVITSHTRKFI